MLSGLDDMSSNVGQNNKDLRCSPKIIKSSHLKSFTSTNITKGFEKASFSLVNSPAFVDGDFFLANTS